MHCAVPLVYAAFDAARALDDLPTSTQEKYLRAYLAALGTKTIVTEPNYFDRDYLSEFSAFFGASARAYPNVCRRLHFFSCDVDRGLLQDALDGEVSMVEELKRNYLGFIVIRPLRETPFGRSVVAMYPNSANRPMRVLAPARPYRTHLAGLEFSVSGIAWQQQDGAVSACATVALWTMFQASAFDEHHAIPSTADVTRLANDALLSRGRVFPSEGLNTYQLSRSIRAAHLEPLIADPQGDARVFSSIVASLVRSGFPVLVTGDLGGSGHAVCVVGFREGDPVTEVADQVIPQDRELSCLYVHDDNLGPNVRMEVQTLPAKMLPVPPRLASGRQSVTSGYGALTVGAALAAVPESLRVSVIALHRAGVRVATAVLSAINGLLDTAGQPHIGFTFTARFARIADYLSVVLPTALEPSVVGRVRLAFVESVPPTSLFVGVVRVGRPGVALFDLVFDTSDSDGCDSVWATVAFKSAVVGIVRSVDSAGVVDFGVVIDGSADAP